MQSVEQLTERFMNSKSSFKSGRHFFVIKTDQGERTWIGGPAEPGQPGKLWLTQGNGHRVVELPEDNVRELIKQELAQRIADEIVKTRGRN